jgi:hypothetical protein
LEQFSCFKKTLLNNSLKVLRQLYYIYCFLLNFLNSMSFFINIVKFNVFLIIESSFLELSCSVGHQPFISQTLIPGLDVELMHRPVGTPFHAFLKSPKV